MVGLEKITDKIISEAKADAGKIIDDANRKIADIMFGASKKADEKRLRDEEKAEKEAQSIIARSKSGAEMKKREILLEAKAKAVDAAYETAYKEIMNLPSEKYCELVSKFIAEAVTDEVEAEKTNIALYGAENTEVPEKYEILLCERDRKDLGEEIIKGVERIVIGKLPRETIAKLVLSDETAKIDGGAVIRVGQTEINCSVSEALASVRARTEAEIMRTLFPNG